MNRLLLSLLAALVLAPAAAHAQGLPAGGFTSDGVEFVKNFASQSDTAGGVVHDGYYYITTERDLTIYDTKDAENPVQVGKLTFPDLGMPIFTEEDPNTNGKILPVENGGNLMIIDVSDKTAPKIVGTLGGFDSHTTSCILDCTWVYGSEGKIADVRDPKNPKLSPKTWDAAAGVNSYHDVTEVKPGLVLTSSEPAVLLDVATDPENPVVLASTEMPGFTHANLWPHLGSDDYALVGGESTGPGCSEDASATFQTWDTVGWQAAKKFKLVSQFKMSTGTPPQGQSPETTYCVHWFDTHPTYANGGLVAIAWYEHGVRFLKVGTDGKLEEIGWYVPISGQSSDADWVTDKVVYVADYLRGLDVLRYTGAVPQGRGANMTPPSPATPQTAPATGGGTTASTAGPSFDSLVTLPAAKRCAKTKTFKLKVRKAKDAVTQLVISVNGKKVLTVKGAKLRKAITIKKLPKGKKKFSLQVQVRTKSGHTTAGQRSYKAC
jgi:hypothetical protein